MLTQLNKTWEGVSKRLEAVQVKFQIPKSACGFAVVVRRRFSKAYHPVSVAAACRMRLFCQFRMLWRPEATNVSLCMPQAFALGKLLNPIFATDVGGKFLPPCPPMSTIDQEAATTLLQRLAGLANKQLVTVELMQFVARGYSNITFAKAAQVGIC